MENSELIMLQNLSETGLVRHCFSTRRGGVSGGVYESLNLGYSRGDAPENVRRNYEILAETAGFSTKDMVYSNQVHGLNVALVTEQDKGSYHIPKTDGLITQTPGVVLVTFYADCVPLFFLDPARKVIALSHAGWRGTVAGMAAVTVEKMKELGCKPEDILLGIGPSIGKCCFEVGAEVSEQFHTTENHIDLKAENKKIAERAGVSPEHIEVSGLCTMCREDLFFSHRRMGNARGTMAAFMELI